MAWLINQHIIVCGFINTTNNLGLLLVHKDLLERKGMYADLKTLLGDPERNIMNMFALQDYYDADEEL